MKVVLDTNVLMSGIFFSGPPAQILEAWRAREIQLVLSSQIADEYVRVSGLLAGRFPGVEANPILTMIVSHSETVEPPPLPHQVCEDPADDKFLACAAASRTKIIVSGDKHLLKLSGYRGIAILTPRAFTERYLEKRP